MYEALGVYETSQVCAVAIFVSEGLGAMSTSQAMAGNKEMHFLLK